MAGHLPRRSLLGASNSASTHAALLADLAAAAASAAAPGQLHPSPDPSTSPKLNMPGPRHTPAGSPAAAARGRHGFNVDAERGKSDRTLPGSAADPDVPAAGLWREDGTLTGAAVAAAIAFAPQPPANIHHALKRQRKLLRPPDVPRLWTLPRIAAELILALAAHAVQERRTSPSSNTNPKSEPTLDCNPASVCASVVATRAGSLELPQAHVARTAPRAPPVLNPDARLETASRPTEPRSPGAEACGAAECIAGAAAGLGVRCPDPSVGKSSRRVPAGSGGNVAERLALLVRDGISAGDIATANALALEVRIPRESQCAADGSIVALDVLKCCRNVIGRFHELS